MIIAGLQRLSLVDFPGFLSSAVFVQGCNFRCGWCQNPELVEPLGQSEYSEKEVFDFLTRRRKMIEGVVVTGGEPTIYDDLPDFIRSAKKKGLRVKLDTNGSNPSQIEELFRGRLLDYIALDIKTSIPRYHLISKRKKTAEAVSRSIYLTMLSEVPYEFRTTCVPGIVDEKDFRLIGKMIRGAKKYCLQQFRPQITYDRAFQDVKPYPLERIEKFRDILKEFVGAVEIRGL